MIKGYYIDGVMAMVSGGDVNDESDVWRDDIEALLPAAYNFVVVGALWEQSNQEHDRDIPNIFIVPFENQPVDSTGPTPFFTFPQTIVPLASDRGVRFVTSVEGDNIYQKMNDNLYAGWSYWKKIMKDQRYFRIVGTKGYLYNKPPLETGVNLYLLVSAENYGDDDELPVPAGKEMIVIQQLFSLFSKQRAEAQQNISFKSDFNK